MAQASSQPVQQDFSLWKYTIAGVLAGLITGILNNVWIVVFPMMYPEYEGMFGGSISPMSVSVGSFLIMLLSGFVYYGFTIKNFKLGTRIYLVLGVLFLLASLYGPLYPDQMNEFATEMGKPIFRKEIEGNGFAILTIPMHLFAAMAALMFIPWFVAKN